MFRGRGVTKEPPLSVNGCLASGSEEHETLKIQTSSLSYPTEDPDLETTPRTGISNTERHYYRYVYNMCKSVGLPESSPASLPLPRAQSSFLPTGPQRQPLISLVYEVEEGVCRGLLRLQKQSSNGKHVWACVSLCVCVHGAGKWSPGGSEPGTSPIPLTSRYLQARVLAMRGGVQRWFCTSQF